MADASESLFRAGAGSAGGLPDAKGSKHGEAAVVELAVAHVLRDR